MFANADPEPARAYRPAEAAILEATEQLLGERPFSELAVNDIIERAGVSRTSFYAHFGSRTAVIAECLRRISATIAVAVEPFMTDAAQDPGGAIRTSLRRWVTLGVEHGALLRTVSEEWPHDPELRALWTAVMDGFSTGAARVIAAARARGQAPPGADPEALGALLMWGYERVLHVTLVGGAPGLDSPEAIVEPLAQMMIGGVFAGGEPGRGVGPGARDPADRGLTSP